MRVAAGSSTQLGTFASRRFASAFVLLFATLLSSCAQPTHDGGHARPHIRLGTYEWPGSYWMDLAWKKGWFVEAGLDVGGIHTGTRYFQSLDDVAAGKLDAMGFTQFDLVRYVAAGHDLVGVVAVDYSEGAEALVAQPTIRTLRDLRGKRIGLHRGTYLEYLLTVAIQPDGLTRPQ